MKFKCTAHIAYEFIVEADSTEEAEIAVFEGLADDVTKGLIDMDMFPTTADCFPVPMLNSVDVIPIYEEMERPADLPADMPFYSNPDFEAFDPCVYDGYMSIEDYEKMHKDREATELEDTSEANTQTSDRWTFTGNTYLVCGDKHIALNIKWDHYLHSKKRRIREKYRKRLMRALLQL